MRIKSAAWSEKFIEIFKKHFKVAKSVHGARHGNLHILLHCHLCSTLFHAQNSGRAIQQVRFFYYMKTYAVIQNQ